MAGQVYTFGDAFGVPQGPLDWSSPAAQAILSKGGFATDAGGNMIVFSASQQTDGSYYYTPIVPPATGQSPAITWVAQGVIPVGTAAKPPSSSKTLQPVAAPGGGPVVVAGASSSGLGKYLTKRNMLILVAVIVAAKWL